MKYWYEDCMYENGIKYWNIYTSDENGLDYDIIAISYKEKFAKSIVNLLSKYGEI